MSIDLARLYIALSRVHATRWHHLIALRIYAQVGIDYALLTVRGWEETS